MVRRVARARLDGHLEARLDEPVSDLGNESHSGLAGGGFLGDGDDHRFPTGDRGRGTLAESVPGRGARRLLAEARLPRPMRRLAALIAVLTSLAAAAAAPAQAPRPSIPACALGKGDKLLHAFYTEALAEAERAFGGSRAERRVFSAAVAAYVYGLAPVAVRQTVQRFPENRVVSIGKLVDPAVRTIVFPNVDTTYTFGRLSLTAGPLVIDVPHTGGRHYVIPPLDASSNTFAYLGGRTTRT